MKLKNFDIAQLPITFRGSIRAVRENRAARCELSAKAANLLKIVHPARFSKQLYPTVAIKAA